jgi:adenosyl cobinamide kinase/adenosyl cobinamide phosphate guanylyltransferase
MAVILIGGGARSGKSRYALSRGFVATAQSSDEEMIARIHRHRIK